MFYDEAKIFVRSGDGGDGMIGFRREKYVPLGGPDGGDGGHGGDIIFVVNERLNSLVYFHRKSHFRAGNAKHGGKNRRSGASGETLRLEAPPGTLIKDAESGELLAEMLRPDQEIVLVSGGRGGRGNTHFVSSANQAPRIAERGEPGAEMWLHLELKLIADVGLLGAPNAGKSTLLSVVSAAKPKIASYPFTTLTPNLGVAQIDDYRSIVIADIPGLIEGASDGVGLGHDFLRHLERTQLLIHLLDGSAVNPIEDWEMINNELAAYQADLERKPQLVVLNKMDLPDAVAWEPLVEEYLVERGIPFIPISAVTGHNVRHMLLKAYQMLQDMPPIPLEIQSDELPVIGVAGNEDAFEVKRENEGWRVSGKGIERIAAMTYWEFDTTVNRFQRILEELGVSQALQDAGIEAGDTVFIGEEELEWGD